MLYGPDAACGPPVWDHWYSRCNKTSQPPIFQMYLPYYPYSNWFHFNQEKYVMCTWGGCFAPKMFVFKLIKVYVEFYTADSALWCVIYVYLPYFTIRSSDEILLNMKSNPEISKQGKSLIRVTTNGNCFEMMSLLSYHAI